jgi:putative peptide zinc metalloprotease protein
MSRPLATIDRPLALRLRPDVEVVRVEMAGTPTWIVKDPLTLEHFQFSAEEFTLVDRLRRSVSIAQLQRAYQRQFPAETITPEAIWDFLSRLHASGLLVSDAAGQDRELLSRARKERLRNLGLACVQLLAIRFRGVDPDAVLTAVDRRCGWLFSRGALVAVALLVGVAASLVIGHAGDVAARLPELSALVDARNLPWLMLSLAGVKVLHELGHAMACKRLGGEVHELGFMLLAFTPCLYCDVTDAWRLPSKWQRILVSAAGMLVELVLASAAAIVWWYAQPGVVQLVALNVILVCTVSTLAVNGNPLLRYDGYYILSDLVETPNLWQRSRDVLRSLAARWFTRHPEPEDRLLPGRGKAWLAAYAVASKLYLTVVIVAIVWGVARLLYPWHLETLAYAVGLTVLGGIMAGPIGGAVRLARNPIRRADVRKGRAATALAVAAAAAIGVLALPVDYYVRAPLLLLPTDAARVYTTIDGTLASAVPVGTHVEPDERIAQLENDQVELELARLEGQHRLQELRVSHLEALRGVDPEANDQLPAAEAALADLARRLDDRRRDAERLALVAPAAGVVMAAPRVAPRAGSGDPRATGDLRTTGDPRTTGRLPQWSGAILDRANRGAHVQPGTLVCLVGNPDRLSAVLVVDDTDVERLKPGQAVRMVFDELPDQIVKGRVVDVARHEAAGDSVGAARADLAPLLAGLVASGRSTAHYQVRVGFNPPAQRLVVGGRGEGKIAAERITVARRIWRWLAQTFRLPM